MSKTRRDLNNLKGNKGNQTSNKDPSFLVAGKSELSRNQLLNRSPDFTVKTEQTNHTSTKVTSVSDNRQEQAETMMPLEYSNYNDFGSKYESNSDDIYKNKQKKQFYGYREQQQQQQQQQQRKEQQCLDYLGDTEETSPAHLCTFKSPSELAVQLRSLRLRHCCERNVFSALHTVALNATLSGGVQCVRTLMDVMDLDLLATRITCEVAEILFRFDCRQVYSLIHQCDDCKEAYRRWVCSTLVPYFAEESDISVSPSYTTKINNNSNKRNNSENDQLNSNKSITKNENTILKGITSNKTSLMFPNVNNKDILNDTANITGVSEQRAKREQNRILANTSPRDNDREVDRNFMQTALKRRRRDVNDKCNWQQQQERQQGKPNNPEQLQQSNIFISTAIKADPCIEDPVISKKIKRSKRKVQFRKRRRIRPCLSVCQTVEQKCPYLLPADRAPALPTQYAGEPTFLCLDQSIPETGEQLRKSSYGPSECCYSYCDNIADGICAYCYEFVQEADSIFTIGNSTRRLHNITITATSQYKLDARLEASLAKDSTSKLAASISIALNNSSATAVGGQIDRLPYYALYDGIYYYDENTSDMPDVAMSDDCPPVPSVTSRCSIPYYASSALPIRLQQKAAVKDVIGHHVLLLLSAMLCLLTSHTAAIQLKHSAHPNQKNRKYLVHGSKPSNIASMLMVSNSKASSPIYTINKCMYLIQHRTECLQQFAGLEDYAVKRKIMRSADCSIPTENPTVPTIFSTYLSEDTYESDTSSIRHYVQDCGRHIVKCLSRYGRVMCRNRSKIKGKKKSRRSYGNQNRNTQESANKITNGKVNRSKTTINKVYSTFKKFNESKISSTKYTGNIRYKHVQMNIGNNIKITYRLNSKLYFNSNTKIYRRKKCSKFRNFNIDTFTDYNNNHTNHIIVAKTSKPHTRTNANRNINKNNNYYIYNSGYNKENYNFDTFKSRNTETHCHLFYYYNFNINDWWRRWWRFSSLPVAQRQRLFIL
ncbi:unnamed protein product [Ceratitis capitata]|uniref:(Mediterranean fruit fly) hypothetical protein n=4 Tax=Ceratitis capitata TaxID=7213 RepID=A0A811UIR5_CERCA|nr:unnamed protein product [Ceratitis capitata]